MWLALLREWFHSGWWDTSGQIGSLKSLYNTLTPPFSSTLWRTTLDFLILWRRPLCPGPYKNIFHEFHNLTDHRTYSNPHRHFLTCSCIPWQVITNRIQHFFIRRHLLSPQCKVRRSLIKELDLDKVTKLT